MTILLNYNAINKYSYVKLWYICGLERGNITRS